MLDRAVRVREPDRGQPIADLLAREHDALVVHGGDRDEEGAVEHALVEAADLELDGSPSVHELIGARREPARSGEDAQVVLVLRHQVRPVQSTQLYAVLQHAEERVVRAEARGFLPTDISASGQSGHGVEGGAFSHRRVRAPVYELQQLNGELDVAQAPGTELQLAVDLFARDVLRHTFAHALHRFDEAGAARRVPHEGRDGCDVSLSEVV